MFLANSPRFHALVPSKRKVPLDMKVVELVEQKNPHFERTHGKDEESIRQDAIGHTSFGRLGIGWPGFGRSSYCMAPRPEDNLLQAPVNNRFTVAVP